MGGDRSVILEAVARPIFHTALLFSVFLLFAGHNAPGGGFVGGLVAGAALVLRYVEAGTPAVLRTARVAPEVLLGTGLGLALLTSTSGWLGGGELLESRTLEIDAPLLGTIKTTTALPFDIGVYLVVVGLVLLILTTLGPAAEEPET